jgi:polysaccharide export outer membrane protein
MTGSPLTSVRRGRCRVHRMRRLNGKRSWVGAVAAAVLGCAGVGQYVWAEALPETTAEPAGEYKLAPGDVISVRVFNQEAVSGRTRVRPDGRVTVTFVNDVPAAGRTPQELAKALEVLLRDFINRPVVTVLLEEQAPAQLSVLGEVARPGVYPLERGQGVLRALAAAGGLTEFAHKDRIFLVRAGSPGRIRFTFEELSIPGTRSARFRLQNEDVVMVQ